MGTNYIAPIWRMPRNANKDKLSNYSIAFNPSDPNYIEISDNILTGLENFSISVWYNTNTLSGDRAILGSWSSVTPQMLLYWDDPDGWRFLMTDGTSADVIWGTETTTNEWHHIVVTYDGATLKFYHDNGTPVTEAVVRGPIQTRTSAWRIGSDTSNTRYWDGELSQFCLFDYALSADQVDDLYNLENPMIIDGGEPIQYLPLGDNSNPNAPGSFPNISVGADSVFDFDSSNTEQITGPSSSFLDGSSELTISGWIKLDAPATQNNVVVADFNGSSGKFYIISKAPSGNEYSLRFGLGGGSNTFVSSGTGGRDLTAGQWDHFVFTFNAQNYVVYINGEITNSGIQTGFPTQLVSTSNNITIGNRPGASLYWNGELSNIQIWDKELTEPEALQLYNNGQPLITGTQPQEANLKAWYKLNQSANYDPGVGPFSIEKVGSPDYTNANDGCFTTGGVLRWQDTGDQLLSSGNYFTYLSPLILCNSTDVDLITTGGSYASQSSQLEYALEYSVDGGSWTTWKTEVVPSGTSNTTWTVANVNNLNCSRSIQVRLRATGGLFGTSNFDFNDVRINVSGVQTYFETFATAGLGWTSGSYTAPTDNYVDPAWQIPDNRSAYPQSFDFNGKDTYINSSTYTLDGDFSISVWAKTSTFSPVYGMIFAVGTPSYLAFERSTGRFLWDDSTTGVYRSSNNVWEYDEWVHLILVKSGTTLQYYINGQPDTLTGTSTATTSGTLTLGRWLGNTGNRLNGNLSNFQLWDTALNATQAETLYNNGVPLTTAITPNNLKAWYKLDNNELFDGNNWSLNNQKYPANYESALDFDGTNAVDLSTIDFDMTNNLTLSCWINPAGFSTWDYLCTRGGAGGANSALNFRFSAAGRLYSSYLGSSLDTAVVFPTNQWSHLAITFNYSTGDVIFYKNGIQTGNTLTFANGYTTSGLSNIGDVNGTGSQGMNALISNFAVWESLQDISELYNDGTPATSYTNTPTAWWKLNNLNTGLIDNGTGGNNATNVGTVQANTFVSTEAATSSGMTEQNLVNNNVSVLNGESEGMNSTNLVTSNISRTQPYSNYSFNFDAASSDYFSCGDDDIFSFGDGTNDEPFSVSAWVNFDDVTGNRGIIGKYGTTDTRREWLFYIAGSGLRLLLRRNATYRAKTGGTTLAANTWYHLLATYDGRGGDDADNGIKLYVNGSAETLTDLNSGTYTAMQNTVEPVDIGRFNNTSYIDGNISNTALFNRVLTEDEILNIYNNGVPQDLQVSSTFSNNIIAWWPMDDRSSYYDGTDWVIRDLENGNDGDGANTGNVDDLVGNAPGSDASGTGNNLAIGDLKGNMKSSDKNAHSINMADYADGVTNPANSGRSTDTP